MTQPRPERWGLNSLLVTGVLALAPHMRTLPVWVLLACAGGMIWRFAIDNRGWSTPGRLLRLSLTLLLVAAIYRHYGTLLGRDAGAGLLAGLLALKLLELRQLRDCVVAVCLCYLLVLAAFLHSQTPMMVLYGGLVVLTSIATLVRLNQPASADWRYDLQLAGMLMLKGLPLMLAMFILFPRIQGGLWSLPSDAYSGLTGLSEVMQPGSIHRLSASYTPAFRVEFEGKPPKPSQLYWRALVLWQTDGQRWVRGEAAKTLIPKRRFQRLGAPVKYTVSLEPSNKPWMLALDLPIVVPSHARVRPGYLLEHRRPIRDRMQYSVISYPHYHTGSLDSAERGFALQLPEHISPRVRALARTWHARSADDLAIAQMALAYFREQPFFYTLNPPPLGIDPIDEFLFDTRRGFCGHFASAFVTLMRAAGVPSRIVTGYLGGEFNAAGNYWIVRQADAHAWAEIWVPQRGWLRVDPTAAVAPERVELGIDAVRELELRGVLLGRFPTEAVRRLIELGWVARSWHTVRLYWDATNVAWHRSVLGYDHAQQQHLLSQLHMPALSWRGLLTTLAIVVLCSLLLLARPMRQRPQTDRVQRLYRSFCRELAHVGLERRPAEGALAFAQRVTAERPDLQGAVDAITDLYLRLRYGGLSGTAHTKSLKRLVMGFHAATR
ncbi:MAG: DUF3488 and DUF4129 domain-containing transglutaminase family protein [Acidiferrobacterales bacterium]